MHVEREQNPSLTNTLLLLLSTTLAIKSTQWLIRQATQAPNPCIAFIGLESRSKLRVQGRTLNII